MNKTKGKIRRRIIPQTDGSFRIKSRSRDDGTEWTARVLPSGVVVCDCPARRFRPGVLCEHGRRALAAHRRHQAQQDATTFDAGLVEHLAEGAPTEEERAAEERYYAELDAANDYADYIEQQVLAQADDEDAEFEDCEPRGVTFQHSLCGGEL